MGERESARESLREALELYWPLVEKSPAAFGGNSLTVLRNYTRVTPEDAGDPWWGVWRQWSSGDAAPGGPEPGAGELAGDG